MGHSGGCHRTTRHISHGGLCATGRTVTLLGDVPSCGFSRAIRTIFHLDISPHGTSRLIHNAIGLPRNANGATGILIFTHNPGTARTARTNTSVINSSSLVTGIRNNFLSFSTIITAPSVVNGINHLNHILNPHNLVPGPGANAIAVSIAGTIGSVGNNGVRFHISGGNGLDFLVNGVDFSRSTLSRGFGTITSRIGHLGPSAIGNHCLAGTAVASAVGPNIPISPGALT